MNSSKGAKAMSCLVLLFMVVVTTVNLKCHNSTAHLHFELYSKFPYHWRDDSIPFTVRNAGGPLDERGGLRYGVVYTALPL